MVLSVALVICRRVFRPPHVTNCASTPGIASLGAVLGRLRYRTVTLVVCHRQGRSVLSPERIALHLLFPLHTNEDSIEGGGAANVFLSPYNYNYGQRVQ